MNVACSSATFSMQAGIDALKNGSANCVVVVHPEITSGHNNFALRDHHFIFGDACTASCSSAPPTPSPTSSGAVLGGKLVDEVLEQHPQRLRLPEPVRGRRARPVRAGLPPARSAGVQGGRADGRARTSTTSSTAVGARRTRHPPLLAAPGEPEDEPADRQAACSAGCPTRTRRRSSSTRYANTSSAGSVIAFHLHRDDLQSRRRRRDLQLRRRLQHRQRRHRPGVMFGGDVGLHRSTGTGRPTK